MKKEKSMVNNPKLYRFSRPIIKIFSKIFLGVKFIGLENIPKTGSIILAGTHTSILDCLVLISSTKRTVHFLAKDELWNGPAKIYFSNIGMIPVNRREKDHNALILAEEYLNNNNVIGIFPEGTTEKEKGVMLPFKIGAVKMAKDTNTKIVPFAINGNYSIFSKRLKIKFGKAMTINDNDLTKENEKLTNIIQKLREEIK